jgi:hypothetical protein
MIVVRSSFTCLFRCVDPAPVGQRRFRRPWPKQSGSLSRRWSPVTRARLSLSDLASEPYRRLAPSVHVRYMILSLSTSAAIVGSMRTFVKPDTSPCCGHAADGACIHVIGKGRIIQVLVERQLQVVDLAVAVCVHGFGTDERGGHDGEHDQLCSVAASALPAAS